MNYSPEFEAFWNQYKKAPKRAQGGSKAEAYAEYKKLSRDVQEALQGALRVAIMDRAKAERNEVSGPFSRIAAVGSKRATTKTSWKLPQQPLPKPSHLIHPGAQEGDPF